MTNGVPLGTSKNVVYRVTSSDLTKGFEVGRWNGSERCCMLREY